MMRTLITYLFVVLLSTTLVPAVEPAKGTFTATEKTFRLNGKPFLIRAGELHFPRIPREYWQHRIQMCKAMGMNTICIYLFWNFHEAYPDQFDFTGQRDVAEFVRLAGRNGMYVIVRPGPYACAEWDMGGLPWWLLKKNDLKVRTRHDAYFMERSRKYLNAVGKQLAPLQIQNGGNIIMVQVENEYAVFGGDGAYMTEIRDAVRASGFNKVQLFRCDWSSTFNRYKVDDVAVTLNFGAGSKIDDQFKEFKRLYPESPLMCSEYWTGWFDHWGRRHETRSVDSFIGSLKDMMDRRISFSLYMAHGGTSFGQWGGGNSPPYSCMVSSYDYNAPINEAGQATEKFVAVRNLLKNYLNEGESIPEPPAAIPMISLPEIRFTETAAVMKNLPPAKFSENIQSMEMFDQGWGRIIYQTKLPAAVAGGKLVMKDVHDWALVFINGVKIGKLDRRRNETEVKLPDCKAGDRLDILVEAMGRVNYGEAVIDRKGITQSVTMVPSAGTATELKGWNVYNLAEDYPIKSQLHYQSTPVSGPAWYRATVQVDQLGDTYLDMSAWGKGMVWVNGHNLGRYWKLGPQQTMYLPGCWLKKGANEIIVLDLEGPSKPVLVGRTTPILDVIHPDDSLLHRKAGQTLDLAGEAPVISGSLPDQAGWSEVKFSAPVSARYVCLEATSSQRPNESFTSLAELEILNDQGEPLPRGGWSLVYADSEEIVSSNNTADKVFDKQESTFWHTAWSDGKTSALPHQIVIDMGSNQKISGFKVLPRGDQIDHGKIKDFRFFAKSTPFRY